MASSCQALKVSSVLRHLKWGECLFVAVFIHLFCFILLWGGVEETKKKARAVTAHNHTHTK